MPDSTEALIAGLRRWTREHDPHVRAAVELLIWHGAGGYWLRRADFTTAAVKRDGREAWIDWDAAREFVDAGARASSSEMAILDLVVALGENRYRLSIMGRAHSRAIANAVTAAVGLGEVRADG
jgi:hypothetical protein